MPRKTITPANCLSMIHPDLASEWHSSNSLTPDQVTAGSNKTVKWRCAEGHVWDTTIWRRTHGHGCPQCYNLRRSVAVRRGKTKGKQTLDESHPDLVLEWHASNSLTPDQVSAGSRVPILWQCRLGHTWTASLQTRTTGHGCPTCYEARRSDSVRIGRSRGKQTLDITHPDLVVEWHTSNRLTPSEVIPTSAQKVQWQCSKGHIWSAAINSRVAGCDCPDCSYEMRSEDRKRTTMEYVSWVRILHGGRYDYSLTFFDGVSAKIDIICPSHGVFSQTAKNHLNGHGCHQCAAIQRGESIRGVKSKGYTLTSPESVEHKLYGWTAVVGFCKLHGLSEGTFQRNLLDGWPPSKRGKNAGWIIVETDLPVGRPDRPLLTEDQQNKFDNLKEALVRNLTNRVIV